MFKVLIAEDEPPIMRMIKSTLESVDSDFKVTECCINGKNAVEKLKNEDFDIVITDIKMPIMTGIELAGWIYQNKPDTKVIIVSGYSDFEYARKALEYKVFDYLLKPISKDKVSELTARIKSEIGSKSKMSDDNNTIVVLACAGHIYCTVRKSFFPVNVFGRIRESILLWIICLHRRKNIFSLTVICFLNGLWLSLPKQKKGKRN